MLGWEGRGQATHPNVCPPDPAPNCRETSTPTHGWSCRGSKGQMSAENYVCGRKEESECPQGQKQA